MPDKEGSKGVIRIKPVGPYEFNLSFSFYRRSKFEMVDRFSDRMFRRPLDCNGQPVLISIPVHEGLIDPLTVTWQSPESDIDTRLLRRILTKMFYLDFDLSAFYQKKHDKVMRSLINRFPGFRPILTPNLFEAAAWAIIGQQVNLQFAYRIKSRLVEYVGRTFEIDGEAYHLFPRPHEVAEISHERLMSMQFSGRKAEYLHDLAVMIADGQLNLESLQKKDFSEAEAELLNLRGIGPWSANYILLRGAGHRDAFPIGDSGINRAVMTLYGLSEKPDTSYLLDLAERWRPYRSLATFYLWKSLG
jgi:DNA-3-methyladenine glycosylase II